MTDDSTTEETVSVDAMTFWTSKSVIEWLMANTNESDIIVVKEGTDGEENPNPVLFDFTIGAVEVTEFMAMNSVTSTAPMVKSNKTGFGFSSPSVPSFTTIMSLSFVLAINHSITDFEVQKVMASTDTVSSVVLSSVIVSTPLKRTGLS